MKKKYSPPQIIGDVKAKSHQEHNKITEEEKEKEEEEKLGEEKGEKEKSEEEKKEGLKYRCEMVVVMGRIFLEGVFSWSERFFFVSSFGILHLFEHDHSVDLLEVRLFLLLFIILLLPLR